MGDVYTIYNIRSGKREDYYEHFTSKLSSRHFRLKQVISAVGPIEYKIPIWKSLDDAILYSIIGQMLSVKASKSIINRLHKEIGSTGKILRWAERNENKVGAIKGVSERKRKALACWSKYKKQNRKSLKKWKEIPLDELRKQIMEIWGLGRWSADMVAIFHFGRMDVWPENDLGIIKASRLLFKNQDVGIIKKYIRGCETVASLYMWEMLDNNIEF